MTHMNPLIAPARRLARQIKRLGATAARLLALGLFAAMTWQQDPETVASGLRVPNPLVSKGFWGKDRNVSPAEVVDHCFVVLGRLAGADLHGDGAVA